MAAWPADGCLANCGVGLGACGANSDPMVTFLVALITSGEGSNILPSLSLFIFTSKQAEIVDVCNWLR